MPTPAESSGIKSPRRGLAAVVGIAVAALVATAISAPAAALAAAPPTTPATVSADVLPTPQINGVVWSVAVVGNTAYAGGSFTKARPAGSPAGTNEVTRNNAMAFDITTGAILAWNPNLNAQARSVEVSPDNGTVYVGGDFTAVGASARSKVAAFTAATGAFIPAFAPSVAGQVVGMAVTTTTVYVGGSFQTANNQPRRNAAAFLRTNGSLTAWAPQATDIVQSVVAATDSSRVVLGGRFQTLNGAPIVGIGATNGATGANAPFAAPIIPTAQGSNRSWVTDMILKDGVIYGTADGEGGHWFDGRFAADFATGNLIWLDNCYGASYGTALIGQVDYSVGHAHDCTSVGTFPDPNPGTWHRAIAETTFATGTDQTPPASNSQISHQPIPTQLHWYPLVNTGSYTGQYQGGWSLASTSNYLVMGGEFTTVNGAAHQGLAVFAARTIAPNKVAPVYSTALKPSVISVSSGAARIAFTGTSDYDDATLTYSVLRDNSLTPIKTLPAYSPFWALPQLGYVDTGLAAGSSHTYRIQVSDPSGNNYIGPRSDPVTISSAATSAYADQVIADGATSYWPLDEASGTTVYDHAGFSDADAGSSVSRGTAGAIPGDTASTFPGTGTGIAATRTPIAGPNTFTIEAWFKTTSTSGGKIVGFGASRSGDSGSYDRHVYMDNAGRVTFGVYPGGVQTVSSPPGLNDGQWHLVTASLGANGMTLSIDGLRVARNGGVTTAQDYSGYWRIGGDNINSWPNTGSSENFSGAVDDVAIYPTALGSAQVTARYDASGRTAAVPVAPTDAYGKAVYNDNPDIFWRLDDTSGSTAADASASPNPGVISGGVTKGQTGALSGGVGTAYRFNGSSGTVASTASITDPGAFSLETWFKTTTTQGGKLIGFGNEQSGNSSNYDRHVYMQDDGTLAFGVWTGATNLAVSPDSYNDGNWHYVVATQGGDGMTLYVDGAEVASNPQTDAQAYTGYWRIGGDTTWSSSSAFLDGWLDEAAVYSAALSPARVLAHYRAGGGVVPNNPPEASFTADVTDATVAFDAADSSDSDGTIESYAWDFGDGHSGTGVSPEHTYTTSGSYDVALTVKDDADATDTATKSVDVTVPPVDTTLARDAFGRTVSNGFGGADVGGNWTTSNAASNFAVNGGVGKITMAAPGAGSSIYLSSVSSSSTEASVNVAMDAVTTGSGAYASLIGRSIPGAGDYRMKLVFKSNSTISISLLRSAADGSSTVLGTETVVPGLSYTPGVFLTVRLQVTRTSPTTIQARVWAAGTTEPSTWQKTATDTTAALQAAGRIGLYSYLSGSATASPRVMSWDDLWAGAPQ